MATNIDTPGTDILLNGLIALRGGVSGSPIGGSSAPEVITNQRLLLQDEFAAFNTADNWEVVQTGAGMSIGIDGTTVRYLKVSTGTTINSETIIRSRVAVRLPIRAAVGFSMSQRIANQEVYLDLIGCDAGGVPETGAVNAFSGDKTNYVGMKFDGTTATTMTIGARGEGGPDVTATSITCGTTVATGSSPNYVPATNYEIQTGLMGILMADCGIDSTTPYSVRRHISQVTPDPTKLYKFQLRVKNLGTAPASSTDVRLHYIRMLDFTRTVTEVIGGFGNTSEKDSVPVRLASNTPVGVTAEDSATTSYPIIIGGIVRTSSPTTFVAGDAVRKTMTTGGATVIKPFQVPEADWSYAAAAGGIINTTDVVAKAAAGASLRNYVTAIQLRNTNATATEFVIKDGTTVIWRTQLPASMTFAMEVTFPTPLKTTANAALNVACITTGAAVYANLQGYVAP